MFCTRCGTDITDGTKFCTKCGAPLAGRSAGTPPPVLTKPVAPPNGSSTPSGGGYAQRSGRSGLFYAIIACVIVVVVGGGAAAAILLLRSDDGGSTQLPSTSVPVVAATGTTTTTMPLSVTTVPAIGQQTTTTLKPSQQYLQSLNSLRQMLLTDDARIPELANVINQDAAHVPYWVDNELESMSDSLGNAAASYQGISFPLGMWSDVDLYILQAVSHMQDRIQATINGIRQARSEGVTPISEASLAFFDQGRDDRDAFKSSFQLFQQALIRASA
jgi:hypothetical protein